ncbi:MAG: type II secretion system F family protein [Candidatus Omnitrophica bacterium]|nr:type II secretion system F family protein [Candidatus Omnitrophota bacterium]
MPIFVYKAKKDNAQSVSGEVTARDVDEAIEMVSRQGLVPVSVQEKGTEVGAVARDLKSGSISLKELHAFTRQLVGLLKSGIPLLQAIEILARQSRNRDFARTLNEIVAGVRNGRPFSACLAEHPQTFSELYVAMARAGEESGRLRELLANIAVYYRKQDEVVTKIKTALTYPAFMLVVGIATVLFILTYVMPRITVLFQGINVPLPWPTLVVMGLSKVFVKGWPVLFVIVLVLAILSRSVDHVSKFRRTIKRLMFHIPLIKGLVLKVDIERFARTLGLLLESGIPILKALEIAIPTLDNETMKQALWLCQTKVAGGSGFGETLQESGIVPDIFAQLIMVGEESGDLSEALKDISDSYDQEITETTKAMTSLLEPAMILGVGLVVGFIVFAMLMPIFQMDIFAR